MKRKPPPLAQPDLLEFAARALGRRALSVGELRKKLLGRSEKPEDVDQVLATLQSNGALDDRRFADSFAASRLENQGLGRARVLHDLRQRRITPAVAEGAVSSAYGQADETALVQNYLARKYRNTDLPKHLQEDRNFAGVYRKLRYAGFRSDAILKVLKRYSQSADGWEPEEEDGPLGGCDG